MEEQPVTEPLKTTEGPRIHNPARVGTQKENKRAITVAIANQKGGVGKTTITRELSGCVALRGYKTLIIDCDPQGSITKSFITPGTAQATLAHILMTSIQQQGAAAAAAVTAVKHQGGLPSEGLSLNSAIIQTAIPGLDLVGADSTLASYELAKATTLFRLRNQIHENAGDYDFIFLDCPPHFGMLLTAALYASDYVLVPAAANALGLEGLGELSYTINEVRRGANSSLQSLGVVLNLFKPRRSLSHAAKETVDDFGQREENPIFKTAIHDYSEIAEAPAERLPAVIHGPTSKAAEQLWDLTDEFLNRLGMPLDQPESVTFQVRAVKAAAGRTQKSSERGE